ncbi:MAG: hypothetical protein LBV45_00005, partial [Xanthomonadaceae bacterium]|nr:hypothetical protein [Xanthomonadaceae bacterium]
MKRTPWIMMLLCASLVACTQRGQPDSSTGQQEADSQAVSMVAAGQAESEASDSEQKPADSNEAVARLFGAALLCQSDPPDGREPEVRQRLESLGVTVTHYDPENDGLLDLHY